MKNRLKRIMGTTIIVFVAAFSLTSCYEYRYNNRYNHHTRGWYDRRHTAYPAGVNFEVDVRR